VSTVHLEPGKLIRYSIIQYLAEAIN